MNEREAAEAAIDKVLLELREHADAIQIMVSFERDEANVSKNTCTLFAGSGNWHARVGMAREFLIGNDQRVRNYVNQKDEDDP